MSKPGARTTHYPVKLQRRLETCKSGPGWSTEVSNVCDIIQPADQLFQLTAKCLWRQEYMGTGQSSVMKSAYHAQGPVPQKQSPHGAPECTAYLVQRLKVSAFWHTDNPSRVFSHRVICLHLYPMTPKFPLPGQ